MRRKCERCKKPAGDPFIRIQCLWQTETMGEMDDETIDLCPACGEIVTAAIAQAMIVIKPKRTKAAV